MYILEWVGFVFGIAGVWLTIRQHIFCFPVGLINVIVSAYLFYHQRLYNDVLQQFVYMVLLTYGWINWSTNRANDKLDKSNTTESRTLVVTSTSRSQRILLLSLAAAYTMITGYIFKSFTDARLPFIDAGATALSFTAQFLIARKKIENWLLWMIVNIVYITIYIRAGLLLYAVLFAAYFVLAIKGWYDWSKSMYER